MARSTHETRYLLTAKNLTRTAFSGARRGIVDLGRSVTGLHSQLLGLAGIGGFGFLVKSIIDVNAQFQTIKSSLQTVTGGAKQAAEAFELIENFAVTTPFDLEQVTQAFIKLKGLGLDPSEAALKSYGNTASALGKSLDQMIEAVADAATGEFERLKEFGIKASKEKDKVTFTFQGVTTTIKNSADEITKYLQSIGNVQFAGAMENQMRNLTPAFSNFEAALKGLAVDIGEAGLNEAVADLVNDTTDWLNSLDPEKIADFTKSGIQFFRDLAESIDFVTDSIAKTMALINVLPGAGQLTGGSRDYKLGDFNAKNAPNFQDWADAIRDNTRAIQSNRGAVAG